MPGAMGMPHLAPRQLSGVIFNIFTKNEASSTNNAIFKFKKEANRIQKLNWGHFNF